jgi:hypothetical protein
MCAGDITRSWRDNLDAIGWSDEPSVSRTFALNLSLGEAFRRFNQMNITARSLFPGLDGYGKFIFSRAKLILEEPLGG